MEIKKDSFLKKIKDKYRLVIMNDQTLEEKLSVKLSRLNVFIIVGSLCIFLVFATTYIIAFTPLKEYIPGYADFDLAKDIYTLTKKADSLERVVESQEFYVLNIKNILEGNLSLEAYPTQPNNEGVNKNINFKRSEEDSILRSIIESQPGFELTESSNKENQFYSGTQSIKSFFFFPPLSGTVTNNFDPVEQHFGIDIVAPRNEAVKSTLDGVVVLSAWTLEFGYTIVIQHQNNLLSMYKHNSVLLKKKGDFVKAGEVISIIGETGLYTTGIHLHFELWFNGIPVNPKDYIIF
ncbi:MAG: peptidoglycan DD-metalloendopeptidase family protein [Bacteroidales bacterium]|nr:peptidoglycan DD-metalloendopeptidase family protein [Bacteroidales bacterium]